ncbi:unnamed protein product [Caretta caretta]
MLEVKLEYLSQAQAWADDMESLSCPCIRTPLSVSLVKSREEEKPIHLSLILLPLKSVAAKQQHQVQSPVSAVNCDLDLCAPLQHQIDCCEEMKYPLCG